MRRAASSIRRAVLIGVLSSTCMSALSDAEPGDAGQVDSGVLPPQALVTSPVTLFDFETEAQIGAWRIVGPGSVERTMERAASGRYSAKITLRVWNEGDPPGPTGPALGDLSKWSFAHLVYDPVVDWSFWGRWRAKVFIEGEGSFYHEVLDVKGKKWWRPLSLEACRGEWGTVEFPFTGGVDLTQIAQQWFYRSADQPQVTFYIDDIELTDADTHWLDTYPRRLPGPPKGAPARREAELFIKELAEAVANARQRLADKSLTLRQAQELRNRLEQLVTGAHRAAREAVGEQLVAAAQLLNRQAEYGVGVLDSMERPFVRDLWFAARPALGRHIKLARGEMEAVQLVVYSRDRSLRNCHVAGERLEGPGGALLPAPDVSVVGSFFTGRPGTYPVDYDGWHADVLLPSAPVDVPAGDFQAFWVRIRVPRDQPPGTYRGEVAIRADSEGTVAFPLAVTVWPFALPERPSLDNALSFDEGQVAAVYGKSDKEMVRRYAEFLLRNRIDFTSIYRKTPPDPELLHELHQDVRPFRFNILGLNRYMAEISPEQSEPHVKFALSQIGGAVAELERRGLLEHAYLYGFDELPPSRAQNIARIAGKIHGEFPQIPILTTTSDPTYGAQGVLGEAIAAFCPRVAAYDLQRADLARAQGKKVWWYFCQGAYLPNVNWYLQYPLIDVRMLFGPMAARYRPDGVLYWSINSWTNGGIARPLEGGPLFPDIAPGWKGDHGEGLLVYPGPDGPLSSVRLENVRDGLEDFEYYTLLRQRLQALSETRPSSDPGAAALVQSARRLMEVRSHLVTDKTHFSRNPATLRAERERIASTIVALGELLRAE